MLPHIFPESQGYEREKNPESYQSGWVDGKAWTEEVATMQQMRLLERLDSWLAFYTDRSMNAILARRGKPPFDGIGKEFIGRYDDDFFERLTIWEYFGLSEACGPMAFKDAIFFAMFPDADKTFTLDEQGIPSWPVANEFWAKVLNPLQDVCDYDYTRGFYNAVLGTKRSLDAKAGLPPRP